jgi:biotin carboxylase
METLMLVMSTRTYRAGAFMDAARRAGVPVTVVSERVQALSPMNPAGHLTVALDDPASVERITAFARERPVGAIVAADDDGAALAARAAAALGLRAHAPDAVAAALDKHRTREAFLAAGLPVPAFHSVPLDADPALLATRLPFPCVVKPLTLSASRGVIRANDAAELAAAFARAAAIVRAEPGAPARLLVEGYVPGPEVTLEALMDGGALLPLALFDKPDPLEGPFFEETIYVTPSRLDPAVQEAVIDMAARAAAALGLQHGPVHAELRIDRGKVWPLEIAPRSIGGLCSRALRFDADRTLEDVLLAHALGRLRGQPVREAAASGVMMIPIPRAGRLREVRGVEAARGIEAVEEVRITIPAGERLVPLPEGARYLGFIFARAATPEGVERALRRAHRSIEFDIEAGDARIASRGVEP